LEKLKASTKVITAILPMKESPAEIGRTPISMATTISISLNQIGDDLNTEDSVEPEHQRAIRHQGLDAFCFASGEFKNYQQSVSTRP
jgi:hypothetical protein